MWWGGCGSGGRADSTICRVEGLIPEPYVPKFPWKMQQMILMPATFAATPTTDVCESECVNLSMN